LITDHLQGTILPSDFTFGRYRQRTTLFLPSQ